MYYSQAAFDYLYMRDVTEFSCDHLAKFRTFKNVRTAELALPVGRMLEAYYELRQ